MHGQQGGKADPGRGPGMTGSRLRWVVFQLHWLLGITIGLVLAVMGVTGATMAFEDQIMDALSPGVAHVQPRPAPTLTPDQLLARFALQEPNASPTSITLRAAPGASPQVTFTSAKAAPGAPPGARARKVYVDPYDGHVLGRATGEAFFSTVRQLHRYMLLPGGAKGAGRQLTGVAALCLIYFSLSGLYLRWPKRPLDWKVWLRPNLKLRRRGLYWSLHSVIGTWVLLVYLVAALTGLTWSYPWYKARFERLLTGKAQLAEAARPAPVEGKMEGKGEGKGEGRRRMAAAAAPRLDPAWRSATREAGAPMLMVISIPMSASAPLRIRYLAAAPPHARAFNGLKIDAGSGVVLARDLYARKSLGEKISAARLSVHDGSFFGLPGVILFMLAAAVLPLFPLTGYLLYLNRRRTVGRPPLRASAGLGTPKQHASE